MPQPITASLSALLSELSDTLASHFDGLPPFATDDELAHPQFASVAREVADRLGDNHPYFHPLYAGQMLKPPHPIARLAYMLALQLNPNNHALDGGRASSLMEKEAVAEIARMFGWETHLGHLCSGGTMANLEALWVGGKIHPGKCVVASEQAHYTHARISAVLGLEYHSVRTDSTGHMSMAHLEELIHQRDVGTVVATMGTTAIGAVDDLNSLLALRDRHGIRVHADAAYGGYMTLTSRVSEPVANSLSQLAHVDSLVIDPHKHGLQPYGCGCVLFRDPSVGCYYKHESPYTYFSSDDLHLGEISLECSRPGAAAVALWATQRLLPLVRGGEFAQMLDQSLQAAQQLHARLANDPRFTIGPSPDLDIVTWIPKAASCSDASKLSRAIYESALENSVYLALADLPVEFFPAENMELDCATVTCLRSALMKPCHLQWLDQLWEGIDRAAKAAGLD